MDIPGDLRQWRKERRADLLARRSAVPDVQRRAWNETITASLLAGFPLLNRMRVGFYWPMQGEFDPRFAIRRWREGGALAALPVVVEKKAPLQFREWWPGVATEPGVFDLPVPQDTQTVVPQAVLMPPVGFDEQGYRLGYGGGYFDRTLAVLTPQPLKIGVAFELSRLGTIHPQPYDIPLDFIVTEAGIHRAGSAGLERIASPEQAAALALELVQRRNPDASYASPPCYGREFGYWGEEGTQG